MNPRIRELYQQAHSTRHHDSDPSCDGNPPTVYWQGEVSAERFAQLIIRECIEFAYKEADHLEDEFERGRADDLRRWANVMKQHFGVKE